MANIVARIELNRTLTEDRRRALYLSGKRGREQRAADDWRERMKWYPHGLAYAMAHTESRAQELARLFRQNEARLAALKVRVDAIEACPDPVARRLERLEKHLGVRTNIESGA